MIRKSTETAPSFVPSVTRSDRVPIPDRGVLINDNYTTSNPNIFAVGDVASRFQFTHVADFMARAVIRNALFFGKEKVSFPLILAANILLLISSLFKVFVADHSLVHVH